MYKALPRSMYEYMFYMLPDDVKLADAVGELEGDLFSHLFGSYARTAGRRRRIGKLCRVEPLNLRQEYLGLQYVHRLTTARASLLAVPRTERRNSRLQTVQRDLHLTLHSPSLKDAVAQLRRQGKPHDILKTRCITYWQQLESTIRRSPMPRKFLDLPPALLLPKRRHRLLSVQVAFPQVPREPIPTTRDATLRRINSA